VPGSDTPGDGFCNPGAKREDFDQTTSCFLSAACPDDALKCDSCGADQGSCIEIVSGIAGCKLLCSYADVGQQGSCPAEEKCFLSPTVDEYSNAYFDGATYVEYQLPHKTCTQDPDCNASQGYFCEDVGGSSKECVISQAWCGSLQPLVGNYTDAAIKALVDAGQDCNPLDDHKMCGVTATGATAADVVCSGSYLVCMGQCGDSTDAKKNLDCGSAYKCGRPADVTSAVKIWDYGLKTDGTETTCTKDADCDDVNTRENNVNGNVYLCHDFGASNGGKICARPSRVCVDKNVPLLTEAP
jgi:hypothetical protein